MGIYVIRVNDTIGDSYAPVAVEADTLMEAMKTYEDAWYPGIFTDPTYGIGEVEINCVSSFVKQGKSYSELHDG
ncbi:unnamed protein product [marine sediment metagenome]|uniref:Uncharacterized protein n=1 Tax=marine sediment metagenome TaxID=412755 RepID=X0SIX0_9ZZZZ